MQPNKAEKEAWQLTGHPNHAPLLSNAVFHSNCKPFFFPFLLKLHRGTSDETPPNCTTKYFWSSTEKQGLYTCESLSLSYTAGWSSNVAYIHFLVSIPPLVLLNIFTDKEKNRVSQKHAENGMVQGIGNVISLIHLGSVVIETHHHLAAVWWPL